MNETILKALIRLFVLVLDSDKTGKLPEKERQFVALFLSEIVNKEQIFSYLQLFDDYLNQYAEKNETISEKKKRKRGMLDAMKVMAICEQINLELKQNQKNYVLLKLLEFISLGDKTSEKELDFVLSVATAFNMSEVEYQSCKNFVFDTLDNLTEKQHIFVVNADEKSASSKPAVQKSLDEIEQIIFLHIPSTNMFAFRYNGSQNIYLNGQQISSQRVYIFESGSSLRSPNFQTLYYTDVAKVFMDLPNETKTSLVVRNLLYRFKKSDNGVRVRDLDINSGQLVGVMGASGAGKSTFLNILNGNTKPQQGLVLINGHDLYDEHNRALFKGVIGYVTQDDILYEELTVAQNLYFNAKLCLDNYSNDERNALVDKMLYDLDLHDIKDLVVGNVLNKFISGGQRKRLNIALELIREPSVLFVDEPTSGLSSIDSEMVMNLLKEQTLKGKIVIVNIHQPSSDIFKMFDMMLFLDKGGYLIYAGNPVSAIRYFKTKSNYVNADEELCYACGNVNTEQLLQIIESKIVNEYGKLTRIRKINPKDWFDLFNRTHDIPELEPEATQNLPQNLYSIPGKLKQFALFFHRDLLSKLTNVQYVLISLLEAPVLAFFLGYFTKYMDRKGGNVHYVFQNNENIPAFIFMSVVVALFLGLSSSAEEIIKDRKHVQRESFLGLSNASYIHSKMSLLFLISAIQMLSFVVVGNAILEIKGMTFQYWLILFSTSCFANILGLNLSSGLNSVISVYILIPFVLVPELLFSGVIVRYEKLHPSITSQMYVPVIGDVMTSRWAYEALVVHQFKSNAFEKHFFDVDKDLSTYAYYTNYWLPQINEYVAYCSANIGKADASEKCINSLELVQNEVAKLGSITGIPFAHFNLLTMEHINADLLQQTKVYVENAKQLFLKNRTEAYLRYEKTYSSLVETLGGEEALIELKANFYNASIADMVMQRMSVDKMVRVNNQLVQLKDPIYKSPDSNFGRAHFYAPIKRLGKFEMDTYNFNLAFIWITIFALYFALRAQMLRKFLNVFA